MPLSPAAYLLSFFLIIAWLLSKIAEKNSQNYDAGLSYKSMLFHLCLNSNILFIDF